MEEKDCVTNKLQPDDDPTDRNDSFVEPKFIKPLRKAKLIEKKEKENLSTEIYENTKTFKQKSPSERIADKQIPIPYKEPPWSGIPNLHYSFEVIKNGVVIDNIAITKPYIVIGKLSTCDIVMDHPSISRYHCVVQYRSEGTSEEPRGLYVYDLESTHGSFQNKYRLQPKVFNRIRVGHILKFAGSTRLFILQGPDEDQEPETPESVSELIALANEKKLRLQKLNNDSNDELTSEEGNTSAGKESKESSTDGIDWGMGEDAIEEEEEWKNIENPFSVNEELYLDDPKKTLKGWFEREGHDLPQYIVDEVKPGVFSGKVVLPSVGVSGKPLECVVEHKGKKKDTVVQCALEACRALDKLGLLRQSTHESHERKKRDWSENDYYDSDEDEFLDRTGDIERKRRQRKRVLESLKGASEGAESYESLNKQYSEVTKDLDRLEMELKRVESLKERREIACKDSASFEDADELEAYMSHLNSQLPDKHKIIEWKLEVVRLKKEELRLRKLVNLARPLGVAELPERFYSQCTELKRQKEHKQTESNTKRKVQSLHTVHKAFLEEEEPAKPKLRKVNCREDDDDDIKPVPYSKPQRALDKYRELMRREKLQKRSQMLKSATEALPRDEIVANKISASGVNIELNDDGENVTLRNSEDNLVDLTGENVSVKNSEDFLVDLTGKDNSDDMIVVDEPKADGQERRVVGPNLPSANSLQFVMPKPKTKKPKKRPEKSPNVDPFAFEKKYESWVPPSGQTGDGRTALNDKFGY